MLFLLQLIEYGGNDDRGINVDQSQLDDVNDATGDTPQAEQLEERRLIGDFDGSANALWTLYGTEAKSYDDAQIDTLKDDMDGVLIFVRPYSICTYYGPSHADV